MVTDKSSGQGEKSQIAGNLNQTKGPFGGAERRAKQTYPKLSFCPEEPSAPPTLSLLRLSLTVSVEALPQAPETCSVQAGQEIAVHGAYDGQSLGCRPLNRPAAATGKGKRQWSRPEFPPAASRGGQSDLEEEGKAKQRNCADRCFQSD